MALGEFRSKDDSFLVLLNNDLLTVVLSVHPEHTIKEEHNIGVAHWQEHRLCHSALPVNEGRVERHSRTVIASHEDNHLVAKL